MPLLVIIKCLFVLAITAWALRKVMSGAPYMPTSAWHIPKMVARASEAPGRRMLDIGAGDGRIVRAFAKAGFDARGVEHNPLLVWIGRRAIKREKLDHRATMTCANLWKLDTSPYDVVTVFGITHMMPHLEKKLLKELHPGARVYSVVFKFPNWKPTWEETGLYEYRVPSTSPEKPPIRL